MRAEAVLQSSLDKEGSVVRISVCGERMVVYYPERWGPAFTYWITLMKDRVVSHKQNFQERSFDVVFAHPDDAADLYERIIKESERQARRGTPPRVVESMMTIDWE